MKYQNILLAFFLTLFTFQVSAQYKFPDDPEGFMQQAGTMMQNTKKERSIKAFEDFSAVWNGGSLNENNKKTIIQLSQLMAKKRLRPSTNFTDFYASIAYGVQRKNLSVTDIDTLLFVTSKVLEKYDPKEINEFFQTTASFLENSAFYHSSYNSLLVNGGTIKFKFIEVIESSPLDIYDQALQANEDTSQETDDWGNPDDHFDDWDNQEKVQDDWSGGWDDGWDTDTDNGGWDTDTENATITEPAAPTPIFDIGYSAPAQPAVNGAVIEIENADLTFITAHDSIAIKATKGSLMLNTGVFVGNGGTFDWSCAGLPEGEIFVELKEYNFNVKSPRFSAEPVMLHYPERTDSIVEGVFDFQSKKKSSGIAQYPRFKSFGSNIPVKGLGENIEYYGGIALEGPRLYSSSIDEGKSRMLIKRNGEVKIKAVANRFELSDTIISGNIANIVIYQDQDSIFHPGAILHYKKENSTLRLTKTSAYRHTPFVDTYHSMEITVDALTWNLDSSKIDFSITNAASELPATFESKEYFEANKYSRLQGLYRFHPLQMVVGYAELEMHKNKDTTLPTFTTHDLARVYKFEETTLKGSMTALMKQGYIDFDSRSGEIRLRDKAVHYVKARMDKKDYDNLYFTSLEPSGNNATLDLESKDLIVRGVDKVRVMDSLNIFIQPENKTLIIRNNRGFEFDGKINTANFQFVGKKFEFNYDSFLVHMPEIDQIRLAAIDTADKSSKNKKKARVLGNELRYSSGTLYLNKPDNKSGRKNFPEYPIFDASTGASVYFDKQEIAGGVYDTSIKFKIPPFRVDSLASDDPQSIGFDGTFESGGIFPEFDTKLVVMPDFSLGFEYKVPTDGFQLYEGKGKYYNKITMDNRGLTGNGNIEFLNTTCYSQEFHFFVDSVLTIGTNADTKPGTNIDLAADITFPEFELGQYDMNWKPKTDSMSLTNMSTPFQLYKSTATLNGTSVISEKGMFGSGVLETRGSVSASNNFHFEEKRYGGRNTTFIVKSDNPSKPAIRSTDCKLDFDLEKEVATFSPEIEGFASTEFPYLKYKTSIEKGVWDLNARKVSMATEGENISKSYFYSTHPHQDSLVFNGKAGIYDMATQALYIEGVPYIKVMDGQVFPDSNKVVIRENALMETLRNSTAKFDTVNGYHHLYNGNFDIKGRFKLKGTSTYSYTNSSGSHYSFVFKNYNFAKKTEDKKSGKKKGEETPEVDVQALLAADTSTTSVDTNGDYSEETPVALAVEKKKKEKKDKKKKKKNDTEDQTTESDSVAEPAIPLIVEEKQIKKEELSNMHTVAMGLLYPEDSIELAKKILYKGKVTMYSDLKQLFFDGFVKLDLKGALNYSQWLQYSNNGDTSDVKIILEDPRADNGNILTTGLHLNKNPDLYTTFISEKDATNDFDIFTTKGVLKFSSHPDSSIFKVASVEKFKDMEGIAGNMFTYDDNSSIIDYSGRFNFIGEHKGLKLISSGTGRAELDSSFYNFNTMMIFNFDMHKTISEALAVNLKLVADIIPPDSTEMIQDYNLIQEIEEKQEAKVLEILGTKEYKSFKAKQASQQIPLYEYSKEFGEGIVLSNVDLKWSNEHKAFYSVGKVRVNNIKETEIDRVMDGYVEIRKTLSGEIVTVLLEPTPNNWYYLTYDNNRVAVVSSNDELNAVIAKRSKGELETRDKLYFVQADITEKTRFVSSFLEKYLGIQGGYIPDRIPKTSDEPLEELNIDEEPEPELIEEEPFDGTGQPERKVREGTVIEEPELNRGPKEHNIEEKKQLQQDQQKMKDLFK